jgi:HAD superfamily hydrolase (TIGR01490 family)
MSIEAAFFDLDRTVLRRSSALALAGAFRKRGVIGNRQLAKAAVWQLIFAARGLNPEATGRAVEDGLKLLRGLSPGELRTLVADAMEPSLKPLVYREPLELVAEHRRRGEPTYIVSAALEEITEAIAAELGFDGAIGSRCEVVDGVYTGRCLRACHGEGKAAAVRALAANKGIELSSSTAYSDGASDLPLLEAVGRPVAVNPDAELRRIARARGWEILEFRGRLYARPRRVRPALYGLSFALGAGAAAWAAKRRAA